MYLRASTILCFGVCSKLTYLIVLRTEGGVSPAPELFKFISSTFSSVIILDYVLTDPRLSFFHIFGNSPSFSMRRF